MTHPLGSSTAIASSTLRDDFAGTPSGCTQIRDSRVVGWFIVRVQMDKTVALIPGK